jgi:hypothetical protein
MNPIFQALDQGHEPDEIMKYIAKVMPKLIPKIQKAISNGYSLNNVLGFLAKTSMPDSRGMSESELIARNRQIDSKLAQKGLMAAGALVASPIAASVARSALSRALPSTLNPAGQLLGGANPDPNSSINPGANYPSQSASAPTSQTIPGQNQQLSSSSQPPVSPTNIAQVQAPIQPEVKSIDINGLLEKSGLKKHVDELSKRTKDPKQIAALLYTKYPKEMKQFQAEAGKNMEDAIEDYLAPQKQPIAPNNEQLAPNNEQQQPAKIEKSSIVASPNGIGTVKELRNGQAIIDIDGQLHKAKEEELEPEPEEVKNSKFDFDLNSIPEDLRSAPLNEVYIPHDRRHVTVKYNAGLKPKRYIYFRKDGKNISTDYINKIVEGVQLPTTSGKSFWGVWNADKADSRGSANYHELVENAQEEGEPDDPSKEYWFIEEEALYEHPYMEKKGKEELRRLEKEFNEKRKKRKKKGS